ncbi:MAG: DUF116 domain-containing protein [Methanotrichaceae archaeon]|nr:DUF116 domain-containing protein [Methanotrichaceae archaeon]
MLALDIDQLYYLIGRLVVFLSILILFGTLAGAFLVLYSFKTGHFFAARLMLVCISILESTIKSIFRLASVDDSIFDDVGMHLRNYINRKEFVRVPKERRFIFMPQCLRSTVCPGKLTPEGIACVDCGQCGIGEAKKFSEDKGYKFFIVPGSSFIKRIIKKYQPKAIVGVGCPMEIKEGLDLCHRYKLPALGIPLSEGGCVATKLDWEQFYDFIHD